MKVKVAEAVSEKASVLIFPVKSPRLADFVRVPEKVFVIAEANDSPALLIRLTVSVAM